MRKGRRERGREREKEKRKKKTDGGFLSLLCVHTQLNFIYRIEYERTNRTWENSYVPVLCEAISFTLKKTRISVCRIHCGWMGKLFLEKP